MCRFLIGFHRECGTFTEETSVILPMVPILTETYGRSESKETSKKKKKDNEGFSNVLKPKFPLYKHFLLDVRMCVSALHESFASC